MLHKDLGVGITRCRHHGLVDWDSRFDGMKASRICFLSFVLTL